MPRARKYLTKNRPQTESLAWKPGAIFSALLASIVVQMFRMDQHRWVPAIWIEFAIFSLIPICVFLLMRRWERQSPTPVTSKKLRLLSQGGICISVILLVVWQFISRGIGLGDANEVIALLCVQNVGFFLAVFAAIRGYEKASIALCGALVFFVCCMTNQMSIFVVGAFFAASSLWWLAGIYWSRLDSKAIDGDPRMLSIHSFSIGLTTLAIALAMGVSLLIPISRGQVSLDGFMPFSGGEEGYQDDFASSGVGDGNMLKAGTNATTTGAVDSNQFIEDHKPSMYDVMTEKYDGPAFKKRRNRAVALQAKAEHVHDLKQSEQSGRTFRTMRDSDRKSDIDLENRISKALFHVEGSVPARFVIDSFQHFDGLDWSKTSIEGVTPLQPKLRVRKQMGKPFFKLSQSKSDYLTTSRAHRIKIMRLQTPSLPSPAFLNQWHIARVDDPRIFDWNDAGLVQFDGELIPEQTVIDVYGYVPNYHLMRSAGDLRLGRRVNWWDHVLDQWVGVARDAGDPALQQGMPSMFKDEGSPFLQTPDVDSQESMRALAEKYTSGIRPGWNQVEAIVNGIRNDFELKPVVATDESEDDTMAYFLSNNGGSSLMFSASCAMALRSAGYRTRMASGFLVQREDYDRRSRQSIVTPRNLHMWPEVCLDGKYWIPVEPTPGYPIPFSTETVWQWLSAKVYGAISWAWNHPFISFLLACLIVLTHLYRANLVTFLMLLWWHLVRFVWPQSLLRATRQLIDLRFWAAGDSRPLSRTIKTWYTRVEPNPSNGFYDLWNAQNYGNPSQASHADLVEQCRNQIKLLTLKKIQSFVSDKSKLETS